MLRQHFFSGRMERVQRDHSSQGFIDPNPSGKSSDEDRDGGQGHRGQDQRLPQRLGKIQTSRRRSKTRLVCATGI